MDYLFDSYVLGFLPGHTSDNNKNVVILCLVAEKNITALNSDIIVSNKISNIISIIDKKFNEYSSAVNSYDNNCQTFNKFTSMILDKQLRLYRNMRNAYDIHKVNRIIRTVQYNDLGNLELEGFTINGLFSGKIKNKENLIKNIKDGVII